MRKIFWIATFWIIATSLQAQVYPGDANNSGKVDQADVLYTGYAYGSAGPARIETGTIFEEMPVSLDWQQTFPNGVGYAHADANGNGQVNLSDMLAVVTNFGQSHSTPVPVVFPAAVPGMDAALTFTPDLLNPPLTAGSIVNIALDLDYPNLPTEVNGLAFEIAFNKNYIQSISLNYDQDWLGGTSESFRFQTISTSQTDRLKTASTRYGVNPTAAAGRVGMLSIVIEDDLITFMQADSTQILLKIREVMLVDDSLELQPVVTDSLMLTVYNPSFLVTQTAAEEAGDMRLLPNPVSNGRVLVGAPKDIERICVFNMLGQPVYDQQPGTPTFELAVPGSWPTGYYLVRLQQSDGLLSEQLLYIIQ
ncbi:MAG: T9SS type A sorting domain-containing protein [Phaeodactylibacter sp.]|uniref:T9SS type A sorting domain-containing protein n=1 Tax=Phaeodactylibacter sp. TaxID=1940289 RepID=UPI0032EAA9A5